MKLSSSRPPHLRSALLVCLPLLGLAPLSQAASVITNGDFELFTDPATPTSWTKNSTVTGTQVAGLNGTGSAVQLGLSGANVGASLSQTTTTTVGPMSGFNFSLDFSQSALTGRVMNVTLARNNGATNFLSFAIIDGKLNSVQGSTFAAVSSYTISANTAYHLDIVGTIGAAGTYSVRLYALSDPTTMLVSLTDQSRWQTTPTDVSTLTDVFLQRGRSTADWTADNVFFGAIPEPSAIALLGLGSLAAVLRRRRA